MSAAREAILGKLRRRLDAMPGSVRDTASVDARLAQPAANLVPERARATGTALVPRFEEMLKKAAATLTQVDGPEAVPEAVADYLRSQNLPPKAFIAPDAALTDLDWSAAPALELSDDDPAEVEGATVTAAIAGVAETGTVVMSSADPSCMRNHLLAETSIVVLSADTLVGGYEEVWARLRRSGDAFMPRAINLITGPSRTGDIEQVIELGAHGPARVHVILVGEAPPS